MLRQNKEVLKKIVIIGAITLLFLGSPLVLGNAFAQTPAAVPVVPAADTGDTAFLLISAALLLLMTPGLAFFYGGFVRFAQYPKHIDDELCVDGDRGS